MPRTKGSKNRITASTDFDAQIAKLVCRWSCMNNHGRDKSI